MVHRRVRERPAIDYVRRGDEVVIRTAVRDTRAEDIRVEVRGDVLEVSVPARSFGRDRRARSTDAEPPLSAPDEKALWDAQRPLMSEDRRTSLHLEGFSDEQANAVREAVGDDAAEEAQGGSATGSDVFSEHGGFPTRTPDTDEERSES